MMNKMLDSFINEYKDAFDEYFNTKVMLKLEKRDDFVEIKDKINESCFTSLFITCKKCKA